MDLLPIDLEDIILDYKLDLEINDTRKKFQKSLDIIKQFNHRVFTSSKRPLEQTFLIANITARVCDLCHDYILATRNRIPKRKHCICRYH